MNKLKSGSFVFYCSSSLFLRFHYFYNSTIQLELFVLKNENTQYATGVVGSFHNPILDVFIITIILQLYIW